MRSHVVVSSFCASILGLLLVTATADAAEFTDLLDAADDFDDFDEATYDPFDFNIEPSFRFDLANAQITREAPCVPDASAYNEDIQNNPRLVDASDPETRDRCSDESIVFNREMLYQHTQSTLDVTLRAGVYKDLELRLTVPYVLNSSHGLKYDDEATGRSGGVDESNSSVDPSTDRVRRRGEDVFEPGDSPEGHIRGFDEFNMYRYFDLDDTFDNIERTGFADPSVGVFWAPYNDERDDTKATLLLGMEYTMPIAPVKEADDTDVGEGKHVLHWRLASSKRFEWIEPYFGLDYFLPLAASDSPIRQVDGSNEGQVFTNPPQRGKVTVGTEFIPYQNDESGERYAIDLRFSMGYVSEGRDYTPLYDHMVNSECNYKTVNDVLPEFDGETLTNPDDVACAWIVQKPANAEQNDPVYDLSAMSASERENLRFATDGIMTVEDYGTFAGLLGFYLQPSEYFQLKALVQLKHRQEHFLTDARTGRDVDNEPGDEDDTVDLTGPDSELERNPVYNPTYDSSGNRFRIQEFNTWTFLINAALQF